jgi:hypothetical protein
VRDTLWEELKHGSIAQVGAPLDLYHHPHNLFVAGFLGSPTMNFLSGRFVGVEGGMARVRLMDGQVVAMTVSIGHLQPEAPVTLGIRPEPSGRLTISVPRSAGAAPYFYNHKFKSSGTPIARHFGSQYPFGHGLSYTNFAFEDISLAQDHIDAASGEIVVTCTVRNTGQRQGVAVPQLYVRDRITSVVRPVKELKAFGRVQLAAGEAKRVTFAVPTDMLAFTGPEMIRIVEPGTIDLMIGASSADIRLRAAVQLTGDTHAIGREWRMESTFIA